MSKINGSLEFIMCKNQFLKIISILDFFIPFQITDLSVAMTQLLGSHWPLRIEFEAPVYAAKVD
tara:strand:- start:259 stop:450 length:192 start_codon:yes stop_codon:yes gene_type:complete